MYIFRRTTLPTHSLTGRIIIIIIIIILFLCISLSLFPQGAAARPPRGRGPGPAGLPDPWRSQRRFHRFTSTPRKTTASSDHTGNNNLLMIISNIINDKKLLMIRTLDQNSRNMSLCMILSRLKPIEIQKAWKWNDLKEATNEGLSSDLGGCGMGGTLILSSKPVSGFPACHNKYIK